MESDKKRMLLLSVHEQMGCSVALTIKSIRALFLQNLLAVVYEWFERYSPKLQMYPPG